MPKLLDSHVLWALTRDGRLLFLTRILRLFAYGLVSVILALYLSALGFSQLYIGLLLTLTLLGDTVISLLITTSADRIGRRRMLLAGAVLMLLAGAVFAFTGNFALLVIAATIGVISPSGNEVGPFLAIEQAALSHLVPGEIRTGVFAWYNLAGSLATATGALVGGLIMRLLRNHGVDEISAYRVLFVGYAVVGAMLALIFLIVGKAVEVERISAPRTSGSRPLTAAGTQSPTDGRGADGKLFLGLHRSRGTVMKLSALFSLDAFAGGFVVQSLMAYWFHQQYGVHEDTLGAIFFGANILAGISALTASRLAARFGLLNTMVFTHVPSNVLLILVPLMPNLPLAIAVLMARFSISQMDVPTRQSYTMAVVDPDERSAAAGVTGVARTTGASLAPIIAGRLMETASLASVPFYICGGLKIIYDVLLWRSFRKAQPDQRG